MGVTTNPQSFRSRLLAFLLAAVAISVALVFAGQARSSATAIDVVLYGKASTQVQFVVCVEGATADAERVVLTPGDLEITWVVRDSQGNVVASGPSAPAPRYLETPTCAYGYPSAYDVHDLTPGTTYVIEAEGTLRLPSASPLVLTDTLGVTTTGGCPVDVPVESPPRYTYLHAIINDQNVVTEVHSIAPGTTLQPPWSSSRYVATYYGWPGKQYAGIGYIYDPATENFAPPLPAGEPLPEGELLELAEVSGCSGDDVEMEIASESRDNCDTVGDAVQGFAPGPCIVEMTISRASGLGRARTGALSNRTVTATAMVRGFAPRPSRPGPGPGTPADPLGGRNSQPAVSATALPSNGAPPCAALQAAPRAVCLAKVRTATALAVCASKPKAQRIRCIAAAHRAGRAALRKARCSALPKAKRATCLRAALRPA